ncbi:MAG: SEL1-like repeat protein [Gammaproteobacteria bacterium]|nr:SEL1-like repeat protein [Gammaproteobacteria bacterium]
MPDPGPTAGARRQAAARRVAGSLPAAMRLLLPALLGWASLCPAAGDVAAGLAAFAAGDYATAHELLREPAAAGDADAAATLGRMFSAGLGVGADANQAQDWFERAAEGGSLASQQELAAAAWRRGDTRSAVQWWQRAGAAGDALSQYNLGVALLRSADGPTATAEAEAWLTRAAAQSLPAAEFALGALALERVPADVADAGRWFGRAAAGGYAAAQYNMARLLESGALGEAEPTRARDWLRIAAAQGLPQAVARVDAPASATPPPTSTTVQAGNGDPVIRGPDWLRDRDPDHYTVQVATGDDRDALTAFLRRHGLAADSAWFAFESSSGTRYSAVFGSFDTLESARLALATLPEAARATRPWIRRFREVQALMGGG